MNVPGMEEIYKIIGYCGRNGHISKADVLGTPITQLKNLMAGIEYWVKEENKAAKK